MQHASFEPAGTGGATRGSYLTGFALAIVLTLIPFALVMSKALSPEPTLAAIFAAAIVQILVHLRFFLHLEWSVEGRWNLLAFIFTALIIGIVVGGSIWIMISLHARTMVPGLMTILGRGGP